MPPLDPNEEDDIVMGARQVQLRCPLTMDLFEEPVTSKVCKHSFSKKAILQLIQRSPFKSIDCPIAGTKDYCSNAESDYP
jgi:E3 SUMO-protein ligase NSE2